MAVKVFHDQGEDTTITREIECYERTGECDHHAPFAKMLWPNRSHAGMKAVVLELFDDDLHHWMAEHAVSSNLLKSIGCQLARALQYLHAEARFVHLDVKPSNIVRREFDNKIALVDFGMAEPIRPTRPLHMTYCTANYRPPELWGDERGGQTPGHLLVPAVDMWSFGCTWWQIVAGDMLFKVRTENKIGPLVEDFAYNRRGHFTNALNPWAIRLAKAKEWQGMIQACMDPKPERRPTDLHKYFAYV